MDVSSGWVHSSNSSSTTGLFLFAVGDGRWVGDGELLLSNVGSMSRREGGAGCESGTSVGEDSQE